MPPLRCPCHRQKKSHFAVSPKWLPQFILMMIRTEHCEQSLNFSRMIAFPPEIVNVGITEFEAKAVCSVVNAWNLQVSLKGLLAFANSFHLY